MCQLIPIRTLDATPQMLDMVYNDRIHTRRHQTGRKGMTAALVLRACVLKQIRSLSYEELAFYLEDSSSFMAFARLEMRQISIPRQSRRFYDCWPLKGASPQS